MSPATYLGRVSPETPLPPTDAPEPAARPITSAPVACTSCRLLTRHPRRGLCRRCRDLATPDGTLANGCVVCGLRDPRLLVRKALADGITTLCGSHALLAGRRHLTIAELLAEVFPPGDRRGADRRNTERRSVTDRRQTRRLGWLFETSRQGRGRRATDT